MTLNFDRRNLQPEDNERQKRKKELNYPYNGTSQIDPWSHPRSELQNRVHFKRLSLTQTL